MKLTTDSGAHVKAAAALVVALAAAAVLAATADPAPSMARKLFGLWRATPMIVAFVLLVVAGALLAAAASRQAMLGYVAACSSAALVWGILEVVGLSGLVSWQRLLGPTVQTKSVGWERQPLIDLSGTTVEDMTASWGVEPVQVEYRYRTDRHGFRNDPDRPAADVYVLGDSIVVGALVPFDQTVTAQLERRIGAPAMKVALLGRSPQEVQQLLRDAKLPVNGSTVIQFVFEGNDLLDSRRFRAAAAGLPNRTALRDRSLSLALVLAVQRLTQPVHGAEKLRTCRIDGQRFAFGWVRDSFAGYEDEMPHIENALSSFSTEVSKAGGRYAVVFVPSKLRVLAPLCRFPPQSELTDYERHLSPFRAHLRAWSEREGIAMLDLTPSLQQAAKQGRIPWLAGDTHWNAIGHELAAETVAQWEFMRGRARARTAGSP